MRFRLAHAAALGSFLVYAQVGGAQDSTESHHVRLVFGGSVGALRAESGSKSESNPVVHLALHAQVGAWELGHLRLVPSVGVRLLTTHVSGLSSNQAGPSYGGFSGVVGAEIQLRRPNPSKSFGIVLHHEIIRLAGTEVRGPTGIENRFNPVGVGATFIGVRIRPRGPLSIVGTIGWRSANMNTLEGSSATQRSPFSFRTGTIGLEYVLGGFQVIR